MHFLVTYNYVADILERRAPHREAHLAHLATYVDKGQLILGGVTGDPVDAAAFALRLSDTAAVDIFVSEDPYVKAGLVTGWQALPWTVVVGSAL